MASYSRQFLDMMYHQRPVIVPPLPASASSSQSQQAPRQQV